MANKEQLESDIKNIEQVCKTISEFCSALTLIQVTKDVQKRANPREKARSQNIQNK